jgi:quinate dehydrogenase
MSTETQTMSAASIQVEAEPVERTVLCLAGVGVMHSIAPPMHQFIAESIGKPRWNFQNRECPTVGDMMSIFRGPDFAGGVVTMPYKQAVMQHLDGIDVCARIIGAVNNVYLAENGKLRGS